MSPAEMTGFNNEWVCRSEIVIVSGEKFNGCACATILMMVPSAL